MVVGWGSEHLAGTTTISAMPEDFANVVMRPSRQYRHGLPGVFVHARDTADGFPIPACIASYRDSVPPDEFMPTPEDITCPDCLRGHVAPDCDLGILHPRHDLCLGAGQPLSG